MFQISSGCVGLARIEISTLKDARELARQKRIKSMGFGIEKVKINDVYTIESDLSAKELAECAEILHNPVSQKAKISEPITPKSFDWCIEIGFLPGVTDNIGNTATELVQDYFKSKAKQANARVYSSQQMFLKAKISREQAQEIAEAFANPLIQRIRIKGKKQFLEEKGMEAIAPRVKLDQKAGAVEIDLNLGEEELARLGKEGILEIDGKTRRGPLALDLESMKTIKAYFESLGRKPSDVELESLAQTWSEHCKHTIFAAELDEIKNGIFKEHIKKATEIAREKRGKKDNCVSVFVDNSGAIKFGENWVVSDKVETHNSPSALDPFGGAITGIVGVNRDTIGFGKSAKPIANRYGFCFADPRDLKPLFKGKNRSSRM